jgi:hypothetical protein
MSDSILGLGFLGTLTIVFVIFKLLGKLDWSWFWVLSPVIFGTILTIFVLLIVIIIAVVSS